MLFTQMEDYKVKTPLGDKVGKLDDMIFDSETWKVKRLVFSKGFFRKERTGVSPVDVELDESEKEIIVSPEVEHVDIEQEESSVHHIYLSDLEDKKVLSSDGEKVGHIYDVEIATELKRWALWKFLIKTGITSRRLRISPKDITELGETITIKESEEDIENQNEPEYPEEFIEKYKETEEEDSEK